MGDIMHKIGFQPVELFESFIHMGNLQFALFRLVKAALRSGKIYRKHDRIAEYKQYSGIGADIEYFCKICKPFYQIHGSGKYNGRAYYNAVDIAHQSLLYGHNTDIYRRKDQIYCHNSACH